MKSCTKCFQIKELTEFYVRNNRPSVRSSCKSCHNAEALARHKARPRSKEELRLAAAAFRTKNPAYYHGQYAKTKEKNPGALRAQWAQKKANRKQAVPIWLTPEQKTQIVEIYANCPAGHHVDHIIPIAGKEVRGLHVPWNLQYLTIEANLKKNNRLESVG